MNKHAINLDIHTVAPNLIKRHRADGCQKIDAAVFRFQLILRILSQQVSEMDIFEGCSKGRQGAKRGLGVGLGRPDEEVEVPRVADKTVSIHGNAADYGIFNAGL